MLHSRGLVGLNCISVLIAVSHIYTTVTVITDNLQGGFSIFNPPSFITIPDDTILETSEGYIYLLEVIRVLHPQDVGRLDNSTNVLLVAINDTDGHKSHLFCVAPHVGSL